MMTPIRLNQLELMDRHHLSNVPARVKNIQATVNSSEAILSAFYLVEVRGEARQNSLKSRCTYPQISQLCKAEFSATTAIKSGSSVRQDWDYFPMSRAMQNP
jgi:hypothetical protein